MTPVATYLDAIAHLPAGGTLTLTNVPWSDYEQLLSDLGDGYAARISYDRGRLDIMTPSHSHERYKDLLTGLVRILAEELGIDVESAGSTTFRLERLAQGAEPDTCFYVQHAASVIGKTTIDLENDPPPDIMVEVDVSHGSVDKLPFYANVGVPEVWRYDEQRLWIYHLAPQGYVEAASSLALPIVTTDALADFLARGKTVGQSATLRSFREWVRRRMTE